MYSLGEKVNQVCSNDKTMMTFELFMVWSTLYQVSVVILEECCMTFADMHMQQLFYLVKELWPMGLFFFFFFFFFFFYFTGLNRK